MTTQELKGRMRVINGIGYNTYIVEINWRGKYYHTRSHNSLAYDRLQEANWLNPSTKSEGYTERQALQSFYDECVRDNYLGKYNY